MDYVFYFLLRARILSISRFINLIELKVYAHVMDDCSRKALLGRGGEGVWKE